MAQINATEIELLPNGDGRTLIGSNLKVIVFIDTDVDVIMQDGGANSSLYSAPNMENGGEDSILLTDNIQMDGGEDDSQA